MTKHSLESSWRVKGQVIVYDGSLCENVSSLITDNSRMTRAENSGDFLEIAASKCDKPVIVEELFLYLLDD